MIYPHYPDVVTAVKQHDLTFSGAHDNLVAPECICTRRVFNPSDDGRVCSQCGGLNFIRTGTCHTCADCGNSDGCG